jgi:hypothetical protein
MKLKTDLMHLLEHKSASDYLALAQELLEDDREPAQLVSALLNQMYRDTLKESNYREVGKTAAPSSGGNATGNDQARLFVAKGHTSNMNAAKVIDFVSSEAGIDPQVIHDVRVYDNFSFITLPAEQAEQVLVVFGKNKRGGKPLVTRAKDKDGNGGGGGKRFEGGNGGGGFKKEFRGEKKEFRGEKKSFGDRKPYHNERSEGGEKGERKERRERKEFTEKKPFAPRPEFKKEFVKTEGEDNRPARKRENKMVDYLEKKPDTKPARKKSTGDTDLDKFMTKFSGDDLSW